VLCFTCDLYWPGADEDDSAVVVDAVLRYHWYMEQGIGGQHVAGLKDEWWGNVMSLMPHQLPRAVTPEFFQQLLQASAEEVRQLWTQRLLGLRFLKVRARAHVRACLRACACARTHQLSVCVCIHEHVFSCTSSVCSYVFA
jgi:hypothetical protein